MAEQSTNRGLPSPADLLMGSIIGQGYVPPGAEEATKNLFAETGIAVGGGVTDALRNTFRTLKLNGVADLIPQVRENKTFLGNVGRGGAQFLTTFLPLLRVTGLGAKIKKGMSLKDIMSVEGIGLLADQLAFDPFDPRLSNLIEDSRFSNVVTDYLKADKTDSEGVARYKMFLESLGLSGGVTGVTDLIANSKQYGSAVKKSAENFGNVVKKQFDDLDLRELQKGALNPKESVLYGGDGTSHLRKRGDGPYIGSPNIRTEKELQQLRNKLDRHIAEGIENKDWYKTLRGLAEELYPDNPDAQSVFAKIGAWYSPNTNPTEEVKRAIALLTNKTIADTNVPGGIMQGRITSATDAGITFNKDGSVKFDSEAMDTAMPLPRTKTGRYGESKDPTIPLGKIEQSAGDIWMERIFGYPKESLNKAQTKLDFYDAEMALAVDRWNKKNPTNQINIPEAQAAMWSTARRNDAKNSKSFNEQPALSGADLERYAQGLPVIDPLRVDLTSEVIPGNVTGQLKGIIDKPIDFKRKYAKGIENVSINNPRGLSGEMGLPVLRSPGKVTGRYVNEAGILEQNPVRVESPLVSAKGSAKQNLPKEITDALMAKQIAEGTMFGQEAVAMSRFYPLKQTNQESMEKYLSKLQGGKLLTDNKNLKDAFVDGMSNRGFLAIDVGDGVNVGLMDKGDAFSLQENADELLKDLEKQFPGTKFEFEKGRFESGYEPLPWMGEGDAPVTQNLADTLMRNPKVAKRLEPFSRRGGAIADYDEQFAQQNKMPLNPKIQNLRRYLGREGFSGLMRDAQIPDFFKNKGFPALAPVLPLLREDEDEVSLLPQLQPSSPSLRI